MKETLFASITGLITLSFGIVSRDHKEESVSGFRVIPISDYEHGYSNFESMVLLTRAELDTFLEGTSLQAGMRWNGREPFLKAIGAARLDFAREALVLIRHTEGSGSVQIVFDPPHLDQMTLVCTIRRHEPGIGTADMAYYCYALAVSRKNVTQVQVRVEGRSPVILPVL
jgi:hypothetical protein